MSKLDRSLESKLITRVMADRSNKAVTCRLRKTSKENRVSKEGDSTQLTRFGTQPKRGGKNGQHSPEHKH